MGWSKSITSPVNSVVSIVTVIALSVLIGCGSSNSGFVDTGDQSGSGSGTGNTPGPEEEEEQDNSVLVYQSAGIIELAPVLSGDGNHIVFQGKGDPTGLNPDLTWQLFSIDVSSNTIVQITQNLGAPNIGSSDFDSIDISDDGQWVTFISRGDFTGGNSSLSKNVFVANTDGSSINQLTNISFGINENNDVTGSKISANGSLVIFSIFDADNDLHGIYSINANGSNLFQISAEQSNNLALSDDGSTLAFGSSSDLLGTNLDGSMEVFVIAQDGTGLSQVTNSDGTGQVTEINISDDGSRVAFVSNTNFVGDENLVGFLQVFVAESNSSDIRQITKIDDSQRYLTDSLGFSGDGDYVAYVSSSSALVENPSIFHRIIWATSDGATAGSLNIFTENGPRVTNDGGIFMYSDDGYIYIVNRQ